MEFVDQVGWRRAVQHAVHPGGNFAAQARHAFSLGQELRPAAIEGGRIVLGFDQDDQFVHGSRHYNLRVFAGRLHSNAGFNVVIFGANKGNQMQDKITIIEGPSPTFEVVDEGWSTGVMEGPLLYGVALTHLRTFNGHELVERCHRAWKNTESIMLEYRDEEGGFKEAPILAARAAETEEGELLMLWVRLPDEEIELAIGYEDDEPEDSESDDLDPLT